MRWSIAFIVALMVLAASGCTHLSAAPAHPVLPPKAISTETLAGYTVISRDGAEIGPVDGIVFSTETGRATYVVVFIKDIYNFGKGAVNGPQDHYLLIPWSHLKLDAADQQLQVNVDSSIVKDAPDFDQPPDTSIAGWDKAVSMYWTE
jgi:sporulation protein YlmC with PRC-barrel domain